MTPLTLNEAKQVLHCLAASESVLLLSSPGLGKSDIVRQAAGEAGLECRSLLGTQIAPEDVSGVPRITGNRTTFCPPRLLIPEDGKPFCLFLDELPASPPEVQKAFYSLLLERRLGEHQLPRGTWVVAAGNRAEDRAIVRTLSSALINRLFILTIRVDAAGWLAWAERAGIRAEVRAFIQHVPRALCRPVPREPVPFSTPRAWAMLSRDLDLAETAGSMGADERRAIVFGRVSPEDAGLFCALVEDGLADLLPLDAYLEEPSRLPKSQTAQWFLVSRLRQVVERGDFKSRQADPVFRSRINSLLAAFPQEMQFAALIDLVPLWAQLGAAEAMLDSLREVAGL